MRLAAFVVQDDEEKSLIGKIQSSGHDSYLLHRCAQLLQKALFLYAYVIGLRTAAWEAKERPRNAFFSECGGSGRESHAAHS